MCVPLSDITYEPTTLLPSLSSASFMKVGHTFEKKFKTPVQDRRLGYLNNFKMLATYIAQHYPTCLSCLLSLLNIAPKNL
ncbi:hypothetical protein NS376_13870 [Pseudomonas oryzihabitans]|nr:hypothetical protein NS376_13870 [Pseudomonas psychrotolerans]